MAGRRVHLDEAVLADALLTLVRVHAVVALQADQALQCDDLAVAAGRAGTLAAYQQQEKCCSVNQ